MGGWVTNSITLRKHEKNLARMHDRWNMKSLLSESEWWTIVA